jgi:hypothetical protein
VSDNYVRPGVTAAVVSREPCVLDRIARDQRREHFIRESLSQAAQVSRAAADIGLRLGKSRPPLRLVIRVRSTDRRVDGVCT